jgi:Trypsin-like peptidase domain
MTRIDQFSLTTAPIEQYFNETKLGVATGFVWQVGNQPYLITNWHVVTCRRFPTGENLHPHGGRPNVLRVHFNIRAQDFGKKRFDISIRDDYNKPRWLIRPGRNVDIAVVPLPIDPIDPVVNLHPINKLTTVDLGLFIGLDVFVLGYPFGLESPGYPVWKRGSIASEPHLVRLTDDYMLVDTASRPGMSGAPVILRSLSNHIMEDGSNRPLDSTPRTRFIGVYSGRMPTKDKEEAQIGMVWHPSFIEEIIAANTRDTE